MAEKLDFPLVDVAVALIEQGGKYLLAWNDKWMTFTFPMTKVREWEDPKTMQGKLQEEWHHAACRAAAEVLGTTLTSFPTRPLLTDNGRFEQSDRQGIWKRYHFQIFKLAIPAGQNRALATAFEWLSRDEILDPNRDPISKSARYLLGRLVEEGKA